MKAIITHGFAYGAYFTTDHAASSCGRPVMIINGSAYGPEDSIRPVNDPIAFIAPQIQSAGDLAREVIDCPLANDDEIAAAKRFLGE